MPPKAIQIVALLIAVGLISASATFLTPKIDRGRRDLQKRMYQGENEDELLIAAAPPEYAFWIQALGAFRSLITDIVFIQAEEYKSQGRYYDALQLHQWICKLQPRFPTVWEYCSWNMAWNISVTTYTPEERWNWVYNGARLIRDDGLRYNPRATNLYKQIAWVFNNKMSESIDEFHMTYKKYWAWRMHLVLGPPPQPALTYDPAGKFEAVQFNPEEDTLLRSAEAIRQLRLELGGSVTAEELEREQAALEVEFPGGQGERTDFQIAQKAAYDRIKAIADTPRKLKKLFERHPAAEGMVDGLRVLGITIDDDELIEENYWSENGLAFTFFARYRRLSDAPSLLYHILRDAPTDSDAETRARMGEILGLDEKDPVGQALLRFLQRKVLSEVYKLDPQHMLACVQRFGPIDWRSVDSQGVYWVSLGIIRGGETLDNFSNDKTNTTRILFFSLRNLYLRNKITFEPYPPAIDRSYINLAPDINFIESLHQAYMSLGRLMDPDPSFRGPTGETYRDGHINYLTEWIQILYLADRVEEAGKYYEFLREHYGRHDDGRVKQQYAVPLRDYAMYSFYENIEDQRRVRYGINGFVAQAFEALVDSNYARYNNLIRKAREIHETYNADKSAERMALPPFFDMQIDTLGAVLSSSVNAHIDTMNKAKLWRVVPINLKRPVYDDLLDGFTAECDYWQFDVAKAFPEPPGMEQYRKDHPGRGKEEKDKDIETPAQPLGGG